MTEGKDDAKQPGRRTPARRPTSKDVAALAGVAQSTVSYALTGSRPVSKEARDRIEAAMRQLNYHTNSSARNLRTRRTQLIGLIERISADSDGAGIPPYLATIAAESRRHDYDIILSTMAEAGEDIQRLASRAVCDGFIVMDITEDDPRIPIAASIGMPTVLFGLPRDSHGLDTVYFDYMSAIDAIIDFLVDSGHRRIVMVGEMQTERTSHYLNYREYLARAERRAGERGVPCRVVNPPSYGWPGIVAIGAELLRDRDDRLAIVTRGPLSTDLVERLVELNGLAVGRDVSLVALLDDHAAAALKTPVSNVSTRPEAVSKAAVDTLVARIDDPKRPTVLLPVHANGVTQRGSVVRFDD